MLFVRPPDDGRVRAELRARADSAFSHPHVGRTRSDLVAAPAGYVLDAYACDLGEGEAVFARAIEGLSTWRHYATPFTRVVALEPGLREGLLFGTLATHFGFASLQPCRVAWVEDDRASGRFAFGIGTLPGHDGSGEERFRVVLERDSGCVRYDVQAFSRPASLCARLGHPFMRVVQRRFQRATRTALRAACALEGARR